MKKSRQPLHPNAPLRHPDHPRPITRRDFVRQGFLSGTGMVMSGSLLSLLTSPRLANAQLSGDLQDLAASLSLSGVNCDINRTSAGLPFLCFDLAGGANIAGSNVLVGRNSQLDVLSTAGYSKLGLPGEFPYTRGIRAKAGWSWIRANSACHGIMISLADQPLVRDALLALQLAVVAKA